MAGRLACLGEGDERASAFDRRPRIQLGGLDCRWNVGALRQGTLVGEQRDHVERAATIATWCWRVSAQFSATSCRAYNSVFDAATVACRWRWISRRSAYALKANPDTGLGALGFLAPAESDPEPVDPESPIVSHRPGGTFQPADPGRRPISHRDPMTPPGVELCLRQRQSDGRDCGRYQECLPGRMMSYYAACLLCRRHGYRGSAVAHGESPTVGGAGGQRRGARGPCF